MLRLYPENFEQENLKLLKAAEEANFSGIVRHVYAGASLNAQDADGLTALMKVIKARDLSTFTRLFMAIYKEVPAIDVSLLEPELGRKVKTLQKQEASSSPMQKLLLMRFQMNRRLDFMCPLDITLCSIDRFTTVDLLKGWNRAVGKKLTPFVEQMEAKEASQRQKNVKLYTSVIKDEGTAFSRALCDGGDVDAGVVEDESARCAAMRYGRTDLLRRLESYEKAAKKEAMAVFLRDGSTLALKTLFKDPSITYDSFERNEEAWNAYSLYGCLGSIPGRRLQLFSDKCDDEFDKMFNYTPERKKSAAEFRKGQRRNRPSYG